MKKQSKVKILFTLFITATLASNIMAGKMISILGLIIPAGALAFPISFAVTDVINEVIGKDEARDFVKNGFLASILFSALIFLSIYIPPASFWDLQTEYTAVLASVPRVALGGLTAFLLSQNLDVHIFHKLKMIHGSDKLWIRNNVSTIIAQFVDSSIFITIAFIGTMPIKELGIMIVSQWIIKMSLAVIDTPIVYAGVKWLKEEK